MTTPPDINEILTRPAEELAKLSDAELCTLLEPFFPATQTAVLPEMKATRKKETVSGQALKDMVREYTSLFAAAKALNKTP